MGVLSLSKVFDAISNESSLTVFMTIADSNVGTDVLRTKLNLTRKQYYSRISTLLKADLVKRVNGKYSLTTFGKILFDATLSLQKAFNDSYWKLKAIDSFDIGHHKLSAEERKKIIDILLKDDEEIKDIVLPKVPS